MQQYGATNSACQKWNILTSELVIVEPTTEATVPTETETETETQTETAPAETAKTGDINSDGQVSILDIVALQRYLLGIDGFSQAQYDIADMNADGAVDVFDLALLKRAVLAK